MYLLDSNAWIALFRQKSASLLDELRRRPAAEIVLCPVVVCELWYGVCRSDPAYRATNQKLIEDLRARYVSVPLDDAAALDAAELRAYLAARGQPIGPYDLLIAAIARTSGLTLVTRNQAEFSRVPGLKIEDWQGS
ncbi:MAG: PIN domain-containing protein [Thermoguttaceae bacterium]